MSFDFCSVVSPPPVSTAATQQATTQTTDPCCMNPIPPGIACFAPCMTTTASQSVKLPPCSSFPKNQLPGTRIGIVCDPNA